MTDAARQVLRDAATPLHAHEIARRALERGLLSVIDIRNLDESAFEAEEG